MLIEDKEFCSDHKNSNVFHKRALRIVFSGSCVIEGDPWKRGRMKSVYLAKRNL